MELGGTENEAATFNLQPMEVGLEGTRSGRLVVPSMRSGMKSTLMALEVAGSFISLKGNVLP